MDLLESTVADALARVDTEGLTRVSLPSIGLRKKIGYFTSSPATDQRDSQFEPARGTEDIFSPFSVHRTTKLARLDVPQSCRAIDIEYHEQIMFLSTTIMDA